MRTLLYRGQKYVQRKTSIPKKSVDIRYNKDPFLNRRKALELKQFELIYRGVKYLTENKSETRKILLYENNRVKLISLTRQLMNAQFKLGDDELSARLWDEIAECNIDPRRVVNLMYKCFSHEDDESMLEVDYKFYA